MPGALPSPWSGAALKKNDIVSPWTRGRWVDSEVFDHTSVLQFLERWTGVPCSLISPWRRRVCGDLTSAFDFDTPVYGLTALPDPAPAGQTVATCPVCRVTGGSNAPSATSMPAQEAGTRPARALPYQPNVYLDHYTVSGSTSKAYFNFENTGAQVSRAAHFSFYLNAYRRDPPWQYTVDAGGSTSDYFNIGSGFGSGKYDFTVIGPNRFLRQFKGNASTATGRGARVRSYFADGGHGALAIWFDLYNDNDAAVTFTLKSDQYRSIQETVTVPPTAGAATTSTRSSTPTPGTTSPSPSPSPSPSATTARGPSVLSATSKQVPPASPVEPIRRVPGQHSSYRRAPCPGLTKTSKR
ncbi:phospholipase domain-containing protein [Streptomyces sp. NPDC005728]|uniref:phospholipase domain-containing protein n=1 Tax=Streptomyces sp. NPDC005728 TaxID=3157054 RepID=UPI0033E48BE8